MAVFKIKSDWDGFEEDAFFEDPMPFAHRMKIVNPRLIRSGMEDEFTNISGVGLREAQNGDILGRIHKIDYADDDFELEITGLNISATDFFELVRLPRFHPSEVSDLLTFGNDRFVGSEREDYLSSGFGNDTVTAGNGSDTVLADLGHDVISGGAGWDHLFGEDGNDRVYGGNDGDYVYGGRGNDSVFGDAGTDKLFGDDGNDRLFGGADSDTLEGGRGNDVVNGGAGNDWIAGSEGRDTMVGGAGSDVFVFDTRVVKGQIDTITDFRAPQDQIGISPEFFDADWSREIRADNFTLGLVARDDEDFLIYHKKTGRLFFDEDGKGGDAAIQFAKLAPNTALSWSDFDLI